LVEKKSAQQARYVPQRGDVVLFDFDPQIGHEQAGTRPALVLSSTKYNGPTGLAIVCPITNQQKGYPFEVQIPAGLKVTGVILADQVKNADWVKRRAKFLCTLPDSIVEDVILTFGTIFED
jgi:mRNA interferase MazF